MKELRLLIRVKNNRLLERREKLGLAQEKMAEVIGMPQPNYMDLENLRRSPVKDGAWTRDAVKISEYFDCDPEELFPAAILEIQEPVAERSVNVADISPLTLSSHSEQLLLPPDMKLTSRETVGKVRDVLDTLGPREQDLLKKFYGLDGQEKMTLDEITRSDPHYPTRERVRQIVQQGLARLRKSWGYINGETSRMGHLNVKRPTSSPVSAAKFTKITALADDWPGTEVAIDRVVKEVCATWPGQARVSVTINPLYARKLNLFVVLPPTSRSKLDDAAWWIQQAANIEHSDTQPIRVYVKKHAYPRTSRKKVERLAEDARAGGFEVLEVRKREIVLGVTDPREDLLKMRLWFCDRARITLHEMNQVTWAPAPRRPKK
jgi:DNA-binding XRE family transcriptional regulator